MFATAIRQIPRSFHRGIGGLASCAYANGGHRWSPEVQHLGIQRSSTVGSPTKTKGF